MVRKTTELIAEHVPRDIALLIESFIMTMGIYDADFPTGYKYETNLLAGHLESIFSYRTHQELIYATVAACTYGHLDILKIPDLSGRMFFLHLLIAQ